MFGAVRMDMHSIYVYQLEIVSLSKEIFAIAEERKGHVQFE